MDPGTSLNSKKKRRACQYRETREFMSYSAWTKRVKDLEKQALENGYSYLDFNEREVGCHVMGWDQNPDSRHTKWVNGDQRGNCWRHPNGDIEHPVWIVACR